MLNWKEMSTFYATMVFVHAVLQLWAQDTSPRYLQLLTTTVHSGQNTVDRYQYQPIPPRAILMQYLLVLR